jgi:hypothetical protein
MLPLRAVLLHLQLVKLAAALVDTMIAKEWTQEHQVNAELVVAVAVVAASRCPYGAS